MLLDTLGCLYLFELVFVFFISIPRIGIAGSYGSSSFLRMLHDVFPTGSTSFHFHQLCTGVTLPPHPASLLLMVFLLIFDLTGVTLYLIVILIYISLMISDVEHLFLCLLTICVSYLEKCPFRSSPYFVYFIFLSYDIVLVYFL